VVCFKNMVSKKKFSLKSPYPLSREQKGAVLTVSNQLKAGNLNQVLLGVTGSGKTFTMANIIQRLQKPALVISHNKTLAAQLYQELRDFFPQNAVSFFVSYYDYYQPEAYIPSTDTYIEKDADINEVIDKLRLAATTNLLTRSDTIVVASVSCIYNIGSPKDYESFVFNVWVNQKITREKVFLRLLDLQYERNDIAFSRGTFRVRGEVIDIHPSYLDFAVRIVIEQNILIEILLINQVSGETIDSLFSYALYPSKHFITDPSSREGAFAQIRADLKIRINELQKQKKEFEARRLKQKVEYDLEMINDLGYVKGIENYSRYFDGRVPGQSPYSLIDYFDYATGKKNSKSSNQYKNTGWLLFVDESHMTFPQIRAMYNGDLARKKTLIDYGFRLPSALDNRPLRFDEFLRKIPNFIAISATPAAWERSMAKGKVTEILTRPTGIPDPKVSVRPIKNQVSDVIAEAKKEAKENGRTLITTLTKKTAEDLATYLRNKGLRAHYLHSDIATLERGDTLDELRSGKYDVLVGINLLREGLDIPEVSLVAILDADKEGFLRSDVTLIQTMGRAARHLRGRVILYADKLTGSIKRALGEVKRRRKHQLSFNKKHSIFPKSIEKPIREKLFLMQENKKTLFNLSGESSFEILPSIDIDSLTPHDVKKLIIKLRSEMRLAATDLNFELASMIRDKIRDIEG